MAEQPESVKIPAGTDRDNFADYRHPDDASFDKLVRAIDKAYHRPFLMFWRAVLFGLGTTLGATIGAAIVFAGLFYILRAINFAPYIENFQELIIPEAIRNQLDVETGSSTQQMQESIDMQKAQQSSVPTTSPR